MVPPLSNVYSNPSYGKFLSLSASISEICKAQLLTSFSLPDLSETEIGIRLFLGDSKQLLIIWLFFGSETLTFHFHYRNYLSLGWTSRESWGRFWICWKTSLGKKRRKKHCFGYNVHIHCHHHLFWSSMCLQSKWSLYLLSQGGFRKTGHIRMVTMFIRGWI